MKTSKPKQKLKAKAFCFEGPKIQTEHNAEDKQDITWYKRKETNQPRHEKSRYETDQQTVPLNKEVIKRHIEEMIYNLPDIPYSFFNPKVVGMDEIPNFRQKKLATEEKDLSKVTIDSQVKGSDVTDVVKFCCNDNFAFWNNLLLHRTSDHQFVFLTFLAIYFKPFNYFTKLKHTWYKAWSMKYVKSK